MSTIDLQGTPYVLEDAGPHVARAFAELATRVELLRASGTLTEATLKHYYGQTRFEQIAESNAIEGSTLSVGETELAVIKGITISGHDPGFSRDAQALARAVDRLAELARTTEPTTIPEVTEVHKLVLGDRPGAGLFRRERVRISGSEHRPPRTWDEIMTQMDDWETWSRAHPSAPPALRCAVLHAWLVHIHPFIDGNGRTARAIGNLEMIRGGYPPLIIRARKDRSRYLEALARSDAGDLSLFLDLVLERAGDALRDLERAATRGQGFDRAAALLRKAQERQLSIWNAAVHLLVEMLDARLHDLLDPTGGKVTVHLYRDSLAIDDYVALCEFQPVGRSWTFRIDLEVPALRPLSRLAWSGFRSEAMRTLLPRDARPGPSLLWSEPNPERFPPWRRLEAGPGGEEITLVDDRWMCRRGSTVRSLSTLELADAIASDLLASLDS